MLWCQVSEQVDEEQNVSNCQVKSSSLACMLWKFCLVSALLAVLFRLPFRSDDCPECAFVSRSGWNESTDHLTLALHRTLETRHGLDGRRDRTQTERR